jgi:prepilin-type N-terminal cleavage/methylation domain-containing protein
MNPSPRGRRGFSLIEIVIALAIISAIVALIAPTLMSMVRSSKDDATRNEEAAIYQAILGDQRKTFGYVGDVGDYPASLMDLVINPGVTGWVGPYIANPHVENSKLLDSYGQPYEFYLVSGVSGSDRLAIVSRGPDGLSTNTAAAPNVAANFTGTTPPTANYAGNANNADNILYPTLDGTNPDLYNVTISGTVALNIQNFDSNALVNNFVPACPNLYSVTMTSLVRGTAVVNNVAYAPGFQIDVPQGPYQILITAQNQATAPFNEKITAIPGQTLTRSPNVTGLDSSGTDLFVLTVTNKQPVEALEVYQFSTKLTAVGGGTAIAANTTKTFNVNGCAQVFAKKSGATTIRDGWVMPFAAFTKMVGATAATLTVTNTRGFGVGVYDNAILIGTVPKGKVQTFSSGLSAGDLMTFTNSGTGATLTTLTLVAGSNSITP